MTSMPGALPDACARAYALSNAAAQCGWQCTDGRTDVLTEKHSAHRFIAFATSRARETHDFRLVSMALTRQETGRR